ncbi:MAG TPA: HAMP domain-containing sensor histidine kinase [Pseudomonadales bacterium]|nr:HAMP domain-containing sensor histidine kinase [Pseudomonadales bacterium]
MKNPIATLRDRITAGIIAATLLVSMFVAVIINRNQSQLEEYILYYALAEANNAPDASAPANITLHRFSVKKNTTAPEPNDLPDEIRNLSPGLHRRIKLGGGLFDVYIRESTESTDYLWIDISALDERETRIKREFLASLLAVLMITALTGRRIAGKLTESIDHLIESIRRISPEQAGAKLNLQYPEAEIETIRVAINALLTRMDGFVEREKEFIHVTSHELRTPIAVIQGAAEVLKSYDDVPAKARPAVDRISHSSQEMNDIVSSLLFLAKEQHKDIRQENTNLKEVITELVEDLSYLVTRKNIQTELLLEHNFVVSAPKTIVRMIIGNIIRNAYQHTNSGTVFITLKNGLLAVQDSGLGISESLLKQFAERQNLGERRGFGISLTYRLCERFGWKVEIKNTPGLGALVCIDFNQLG